MRVFVNVYQIVCASFPFGFEGGMCGLIVLIPDNFLSVYLGCVYLLYSSDAEVISVITSNVNGPFSLKLCSAKSELVGAELSLICCFVIQSFNWWFSFAPVFQTSCFTPWGSPGVTIRCFCRVLISLIRDLFVSYGD